MKIFVDSGNLREIEALAPLGILDGVTTNPSLLARESGDPRAIIRREPIAGSAQHARCAAAGREEPQQDRGKADERQGTRERHLPLQELQSVGGLCADSVSGRLIRAVFQIGQAQLV